MVEEEKSQEEWRKYSKSKCIDCGTQVAYYSKRCNKCKGEAKTIYKGEKKRKDGKLSKDKSYLSKKAWREKNNERDSECKSNWIKNNPEKRREACKKWDKKHPEKKREYAKRSSKKYPEKAKARNSAKYIKRGDVCIFCGSNKNLEKHHPNYSKPKTIITLCRICHRRLHLKNGRWSTNR